MRRRDRQRAAIGSCDVLLVGGALETDREAAPQARGVEVVPAERHVELGIAPANVQELVFAEQLEAIGQVPAQPAPTSTPFDERIRLPNRRREAGHLVGGPWEARAQ